ncbi:hypothetical protein LV779_14525 [Streptomyces thinghirensis]|nr:hypothetical protein [Streptomyces thinghirensis]
MQYRHVITHAVGHGCAVREERGEDGGVELLACEVLPRAEVPAIRAGGLLDAPALRIAHLADSAVSRDQIREELAEFAAAYHAWYAGQRSVEVPPWGLEAAERILDRVRQTVTRVEAGVRPCATPTAPNSSMPSVSLSAPCCCRCGTPPPTRRVSGACAPTTWPSIRPSTPRRAGTLFQLAFLLLALDGVVDPGHRDRETTDLIWFPTGGGKTEAYLLLAAFIIALRRIRGEGGGTTVLSRYTLSLLTTQQFQRAATTICALEHLRRTEPGLGLERTHHHRSVGRRHHHPEQVPVRQGRLRRAARCQPPRGHLHSRPLPLVRHAHPATDLVQRPLRLRVRAKADKFAFYCPRDACAFHDVLPVAVVDQHLYQDPPTFVLGTVDKFARLAWEPDLGPPLRRRHRSSPPSLIIQDELHLLTGPLGTTVGLYEAAILELCTGPDGRPPKISRSDGHDPALRSNRSVPCTNRMSNCSRHPGSTPVTASSPSPTPAVPAASTSVSWRRATPRPRRRRHHGGHAPGRSPAPRGIPRRLLDARRLPPQPA